MAAYRSIEGQDKDCINVENWWYSVIGKLANLEGRTCMLNLLCENA